MVDQNTRRRISRTGLTFYDEERACPGYVMFNPQQGEGVAYLIDLEGNIIHRWKLPVFSGENNYLLPNGNLFFMGKLRDETWGLWPRWKNFKGGVIMELDWNGNVVWEHRDTYQHHDARKTPSGGAIYLSLEPVPSEIACRVKGGIPGSDGDCMYADVIIEVDPEGNSIWEWHAYEQLDLETDVLPPNFSRKEWSHGNTVVPLGDDRVMVSFRNISTVGIIDKETDQFVWKLGWDVLAQQHDPSMLANGNVLIFDNGAFRKTSSTPYSRVIEVNPRTNDIVWEYHDEPVYNFFSPHISGARRLSNGNTLITEGAFGRMFQVTPDRKVVWEFINPYFTESLEGYTINSVFRANHYSSSEIPALW